MLRNIWSMNMNKYQISELNGLMEYSDITCSEIYDHLLSANVGDIPFANCKIIELTHHKCFANLPHTPRYFALEGDKLLDRKSMIEPDGDSHTYWLPLTPQDDWTAVLWKADKLVAMSGDHHHINLESFTVVADILIPEFGS